jgi:endonuclease/exonuclease/phosphatase family metal-dependent hydrolase
MSQRTVISRVALALVVVLAIGTGWAASGPKLTFMTQNMHAGSGFDAIFASTDEASFGAAVAQTFAQVKASNIPARAASLADQIQASKPDLVGLQEVSLWRTGAIMQPPAADVLYDQLDLLQAELTKRNLHYAVVAVQTLIDAETPVPTEGTDLRLTDRDVILARNDYPQAQFDVSAAHSQRFQATFTFGSALMGQLVIPRGWLSVDVNASGRKFRYVTTHLESTYPGLPLGEQIQGQQAQELINELASSPSVVLAGDFNSNAEYGPERTGSVQKIIAAGFSDAWSTLHAGDPGYSWPLFIDDPAVPSTIINERIDLVLTKGFGPTWFGRDTSVLSADLVGKTRPSSGVFTSDHAGLVVKIQLP